MRKWMRFQLLAFSPRFEKKEDGIPGMKAGARPSSLASLTGKIWGAREPHTASQRAVYSDWLSLPASVYSSY